jgi:hypothetical protein
MCALKDAFVKCLHGTWQINLKKVKFKPDFCSAHSNQNVSALKISTESCCDRLHPDKPDIQFDKSKFFPGRFLYEDESGAIYAGDVDDPGRIHLNPPKTKKRKAKGPKNRKVADRADLQARLGDWLASSHATDPLRAVRPSSFILDALGIKSLSAVHPDRMRTVVDVVAVLDETSEWEGEWGRKVFEVISAYNSELQRLATSTSRIATGRKKGPRVRDGDDVEEREPRAKKTRTIPLAEVSLNVRRSTRLAAK